MTPKNSAWSLTLVALILWAAAPPRTAADQPAPPAIRTLRVSHGGIQPQVAVGSDGTIHLIYFKGDPTAGDLHYVLSKDSGATFSKPLKVNSHPASAIAVGNIRGAHLALGRGNRPHIAWMGSAKALPRAENNQSPMLYTRLNDARDAFEPQRNLLTWAYGLDGGGSLAADAAGNVYVAWHAAGRKIESETQRAVFVARSTDDGGTFAREQNVSPEGVGACGCCGMRIAVRSDAAPIILFRAASDGGADRDMTLLTLTPTLTRSAQHTLDRWRVNTCPMSSTFILPTDQGALMTWETQGRVSYRFAAQTLGPAISPPGDRADRKHPILARNLKGDTLLAWTEGMGWSRGGDLAWQLFDATGKPITAAAGRKPGVPAWSLVAACAVTDGSFIIFH